MNALPEGARRLKVGLVDYKVGNIGSLQGAIQRLGFRVVAGDRPEQFEECEALVLPGVGAAPFAMQNMRATGLDRFIVEAFAAGDRPIIGICLGMQIMLEHSEEGDIDGLGLLPGQVRRLPNGSCHVGWTLSQTPVGAKGNGAWSEAAFYFNHSYYVDAPEDVVRATVVTDQGLKLAAILQSGSFTGVQFHPEKSQAAGADLLRHLIAGTEEVAHA